MATRRFPQFRSTLLEPASVKLLSKSKFKKNITEKQVQFEYDGASARNQNWKVINPGPKRAYKMFDKAFQDIEALSANALASFFSRLKPDDFGSEVKMNKTISLAVRHIGEAVKKKVLENTPRGKSKRGKLIIRPEDQMLDKGIKIVQASRFREVQSGDFIGVVVVGTAPHTLNAEEGTGRNEELGTIKLPKQKRSRKKRGRRRGKK